jgi:RsiW-degrading membrane proteinase PrsW (M82 family)
MMTTIKDTETTTAGLPTTRWRVVLRRWSWLPVLVIGAVLYELVRLVLHTTGDPLFLPTLILLGAAVVPVAFVGFVSGRRLSFGLGGSVVGLTALLGGVVGVLVAGALEYATVPRAGSLATPVVGLVEEFAKLLVPAAALLIFRRDRHRADGLLLGVAAGAGFAVLETMGYALVALVGSGGNISLVNGLLLDRGLLSPAAHMAWTGLAATALWAAAIEHWRVRAVARFLLVYLLVAGMHAAWDSSGSGWVHAALAVVGLGLLVWTAHRLARPGGWRHVRSGSSRPPGIATQPTDLPVPAQRATTSASAGAVAQRGTRPLSPARPDETT